MSVCLDGITGVSDGNPDSDEFNRHSWVGASSMGDIKDSFDRGRKIPWLGNVVDAKHGVFTDSLGTILTCATCRGIICIPCLGSDGQWAGGLENL
jgi:hypothetical protein